MKKIKLTKGKYALVDNDDYAELIKYKWRATIERDGVSYAVRGTRNKVGKYSMIAMHRVIMKTPKEMVTDHIDGDGLNNQKKNLRICTRSQNNMNTKMGKNNTSGFKGVSRMYVNKKLKWQVHIRVDKKIKYLGYFATKEEGYKAYVEACKKYHKEFTYFNREKNKS